MSLILLLRNLEPRFLRCDVGIADEDHGLPGDNGEIQWGGFPIDILTRVDTLGDSDGLQFLCPCCYIHNSGPIGTHRIAVYFAARGAPPHIGLNSEGKTTRWEVMGNDFLDLTLSPSIHVKKGCGWHGWIEHGVVKTAT
jgi:hypothetical protein